MSWLRKTVLGTGVVMGMMTSSIALFTANTRSEAAIAVIDQQNIAEAIKTAINTATILSNTEKEIALQVLNMTKLDVGKLAEIMLRNEQKKQQVLQENENLTGLLETSSSVGHVWDARLGNLDDVINGNMTIYSFVKREQQRQKVLDETTKSAAQAAANTLVHGQKTMSGVNEALDLSNQAEGQLQAAQAGNIILANTAYAVENGNRLLSNATAMMAVQYQEENLRRAESQRVLHESGELSKEWIKNATIKQ